MTSKVIPFMNLYNPSTFYRRITLAILTIIYLHVHIEQLHMLIISLLSCTLQFNYTCMYLLIIILNTRAGLMNATYAYVIQIPRYFWAETGQFNSIHILSHAEKSNKPIPFFVRKVQKHYDTFIKLCETETTK